MNTAELFCLLVFPVYLTHSLLFPNRYLQPQHFNLWLFFDSMNFRLHSLPLISSLVPASTRICSNLNSINWINDWQKLIKSDSNNWLLALVVYITQLSVINVCSEEEFLVSIPSFPQSAAVLLCQLCRVIDSLNICLILINFEMSFSLSHSLHIHSSLGHLIV